MLVFALDFPLAQHAYIPIDQLVNSEYESFAFGKNAGMEIANSKNRASLQGARIVPSGTKTT